MNFFMFNLFLLFLVCGLNKFSVYCTKNEEFYPHLELPHCYDEESGYRNLFFVTTIDGKFNVIDAISGKLKWSKFLQSEPLISSTIDSFLNIYNEKGEIVQLLPSFDGHLYMYHKDLVKKTFFSVDKLLKNSLKFNENIVLVGGQENRIFGLNLKNGDIIYDCGIGDCSSAQNASQSDILLLQKTSQTIRAMNTINGQEEWHFVVNNPKILKITQQCVAQKEISDKYIVDFKVSIPNGLITSFIYYSNDSLDSVLVNTWNLKLNSPIVNMWHLDDSDFINVNLFDTKINQIFLKSEVTDPYLYLGAFNNRFYIQTSIYKETLSEENIENQKFLQLTFQDSFENNLNEKNLILKPKLISFLKQTTNPKAEGYFIFNASKKCVPSNQLESHEKKIFIENIIEKFLNISLPNYWKKFCAFCLIISISLNFILFLCQKYIYEEVRNKFFANFSNQTYNHEKNNNSLNSQKEREYSSIERSQTSDSILYNSRYLEDFNQICLLGKGGFGMVFEAKHKIDECSYAVKRISIPTNEEKRHRFLREIRALSNLDHTNIVRYYNAWIEEPPIGWQEKIDKRKNYDITETAYDSTTNPETTFEDNSLSKWDSNESKINFFNDNINSINYNPKLDSLEIIFEETNGDVRDSEKLEIKKMDETSINKSIKNKFKSKNEENSIPKVYIYIQMQLCQKETLKDWLFKNKKRNKKNIIEIFLQLLSAVQYVHSNNLIHRDLKPSNIFFSMDGKIKIGDFGLVTNFVEKECFLEKENFSNKKTKKHTNLVGTQLYMSPEQIRNELYNHKVDIYSMGIIFYELLLPFNTESERIHRLKDVRNVKFSNDFTEKFSREKKVLEQLLAHCPDDRPESSEILDWDVFKSS